MEQQRAQICVLEREVDQARNSKKAVEEELRQITEENAEWTERVDALKAKKARMQSKHRKMEHEITQRNAERETRNGSLHQIEAALARKEETLRESRAERIGLVAQVKSGARVAAMMKQQIQAFQQEIEAQKHSIEQLTHENTQSLSVSTRRQPRIFVDQTISRVDVAKCELSFTLFVIVPMSNFRQLRPVTVL